LTKKHQYYFAQHHQKSSSNSKQYHTPLDSSNHFASNASKALTSALPDFTTGERVKLSV